MFAGVPMAKRSYTVKSRVHVEEYTDHEHLEE